MISTTITVNPSHQICRLLTRYSHRYCHRYCHRYSQTLTDTVRDTHRYSQIQDTILSQILSTIKNTPAHAYTHQTLGYILHALLNSLPTVRRLPQCRSLSDGQTGTWMKPSISSPRLDLGGAGRPWRVSLHLGSQRSDPLMLHHSPPAFMAGRAPLPGRHGPLASRPSGKVACRSGPRVQTQSQQVEMGRRTHYHPAMRRFVLRAARFVPKIYISSLRPAWHRVRNEGVVGACATTSQDHHHECSRGRYRQRGRAGELAVAPASDQ